MFGTTRDGVDTYVDINDGSMLSLVRAFLVPIMRPRRTIPSTVRVQKISFWYVRGCMSVW